MICLLEEEIYEDDLVLEDDYNEEDEVYHSEEYDDYMLQVLDIDILSSNEDEVVVRLILKDGVWNKLKLEKKVLKQLLES